MLFCFLCDYFIIIFNAMHNPNILCTLLSIQVTRESIVSDALLLQQFRDAVHGVFPTASSDIVTRVHGIVLTNRSI